MPEKMKGLTRRFKIGQKKERGMTLECSNPVPGGLSIVTVEFDPPLDPDVGLDKIESINAHGCQGLFVCSLRELMEVEHESDLLAELMGDYSDVTFLFGTSDVGMS